jgi:PAS domain S-box-containing protein
MVGIQGFDRDGVVCHWNEASRKLYGYSAEEAIGRRLQDLIMAPEDVPAFVAALREIGDTRQPSPCRAWKVKTRDGETKWVYSSLFPVLERGEIAEIFCMDVDVTDRKAMEATLLENEERLRTLINAMPDIVCFKDGEGRWLEANDFDLRLFEIGDVEYQGKTDSELAGYSGFYRDAFLACEESDEAAWHLGKTSRDEEIVPKPDGSRLTFDVIKVPLFHPDGARKGLVVIGRDITARKRAEEELRRSYEGLEKTVAERTVELTRAKNTLQAILDTVPVGVVMAEGKPERITYFSPSAVKILGGDVSRTSFDPGPRPYQLLRPDGSQLPLEEHPLMRSLQDGAHVYNVEAIVRHKDSTEVTILISSAPIRDASGNIVAAVANLIDVTEIRRADQALKESERFLKSVFDGIQDGISVLDRDMNVLRVNHTMEKLYPDMVPIEGKKCYHAYHKRSLPCEKCPTLRALRTKTLESEIVPIVYEDRSTGWLELYSFPLIDSSGNVSGIVEHVRDVTERKRAEDALRESEEKFRVLAKTSSAMILLYQGEHFVYSNDAAERLTGYTTDEVMKMKFWEVVHPDDRDLVRERGLARQRDEPVPNKYEVKLLTRGGEIRWVELNAGRIEYLGKPAVIATFFDITGRKETEKELLEAKSRAELYLDLMGHDISNKNQITMGFIELAHDILELDGRLERDNIYLLDKAIESLKDSSRLIDNVKKIPKINDGAGLMKEVFPRDYLVKACSQYSGLKNVTFNCDVPAECDEQVRANDLLEEVFSNIIGNAIKHSAAQKEALKIDVRMAHQMEGGKPYCRISIEDDGPGIPDSLKGSIFDRLQRGKTIAKGKGLGLFLVKSLVDSYHGKVWVEDRVNGDHRQGSRFVIMLPVVERVNTVPER